MGSRALIGFVVSASLLLLPGCLGERGPGDATGTIAGTVRDPDGAVLSGATITTDPVSSSAVSLGDGSFTLFDVPIGAYRVIATKEGFANAALDAVGVADEATTQVSLVMAPEGNLP
ncbi:MAG TPA: carboxypeptidase-like regulatory domain-containing protein, partial [Gemmatimonadaceae bacterium]|nr:carboxypeptidase-like regulatory domain-containing protein [Gemmatimonadaceae bacterium]